MLHSHGVAADTVSLCAARRSEAGRVRVLRTWGRMAGGLALCRVQPAGAGRGTGNRGTPITGRFAAFESSAVGLVYRGRLAGLGGWGGPPCRGTAFQVE